jgi:hypothetical protein
LLRRKIAFRNGFERVFLQAANIKIQQIQDFATPFSFFSASGRGRLPAPLTSASWDDELFWRKERWKIDWLFLKAQIGEEPDRADPK